MKLLHYLAFSLCHIANAGMPLMPIKFIFITISTLGLALSSFTDEGSEAYDLSHLSKVHSPMKLQSLCQAR